MSRREWNKTASIVEEAREILSAEFPMTLRQCFYRLVSRESRNRTIAVVELASIIEGMKAWNNLPKVEPTPPTEAA
jgi:hypothetical protein